MSKPANAPRRFYTVVTVEAEGEGFAPRLDGRTPRTPQAHPLILPTRALADLVADEWRAQGEVIDQGRMPTLRLAHTAIDVAPGARPTLAEGFTRFGQADLLCYFADHPQNLVRRQERVWAPLLDWAGLAHGLGFVRAVGIVHRDQPPATLARLAAIADGADDFTLAGLAFAAALFGSAILAVALRDGHINADEALGAARLDEIFQEEAWGVDAEAESKADAKAVDAVMAERWFLAIRS